jgi:hypothetical protein
MKTIKPTLITILCTIVGFALLCTARGGQTPQPPPASENTWYGYQALFSDTTGGANSAFGYQALYSNTDGVFNDALGTQALYSVTSGIRNLGLGAFALNLLTNGDSNTAVGNASLINSGTVNFNAALGRRALFRCQGDQNIGLGFFTGSNNNGGGNNIYIGNVGPVPIGSESNTIRIGTQIPATATIGNPPVESHPFPQHTDTYIAGIFGAATSLGVPVYIDASGKMGTTPSSQKFKQDIKSMDKASEAVLSLRPVTFHYKKDSKSTPQFGLVAEEVAKVNPDLVARDGKGEIYSVRYEAVNAMVLNEFLKEHRKVEQLETKLAQQEKDFTERLKEQDTKIQKVSDKVELTKPAPQMVSSNQ